MAEKKLTLFQKIFLSISGTSFELIAQCPETERIKYTAIGCIIFCTSIFATFSGGYTHYVIFSDVKLASWFGLFWGSVILCIDRFLIANMRKTGMWWKDISYALPRIALALILAVSVSRPIELRLFEKEITSELKKASILRIDTEIGKLRSEITHFKEQEAAIKEEISAVYAEYLCEFNGTCGTGNHDLGPHARNKWDEYVAFRAARKPELKNINDSILKYQELIRNLQNERAASLSTYASSKEQFQYSVNSFLARSDVLWDLSLRKTGVLAVSIFVTLVFLIMELIPILSKLISEPGKYDYLRGVESECGKLEAEALLANVKGTLHSQRVKGFERETEEIEKQAEIRLRKAILSSEEKVNQVKKVIEAWVAEDHNITDIIIAMQERFANDITELLRKPTTLFDAATNVDNDNEFDFEGVGSPAKGNARLNILICVWTVISTSIVTMLPILNRDFLRLSLEASFNLSVASGSLYVGLLAILMKFMPISLVEKR